ncbi:MAG: glycosyltransferase family 4 protein [Gammaproteobacteria bacterium]
MGGNLRFSSFLFETPLIITPMHVLHLETGRHLYGGPRQVIELMRGLDARGVQSTLACPTGSAIAAAAAEAGLAVVTHELGGDLDVSSVSFLVSEVRRLKPDLLHVHSRRGADIFGGLAAAVAHVPAVLTRRVDNPDTPLIGTLKYLAYERVVAISSAVRAQLEKQGVPPAKLATIRSSVTAADCAPVWPRERFLAEFGIEPGQRTVAIVAQLIPRKGHALFLKAWPLIRDQCPDARLLIFGTGPLEAELKSRTGWGGTTSFCGFRPDLREFLGHIDLLVHPALHEGLGVSLLEAQAAGVAIVAFAAGGIPEVVAADETGLLVPPGDTAALAAAVIRLLGDPNLRQAFGAAGRHRVQSRFGSLQMVDSYLALYRKLLAGKPPVASKPA